MSKKQIRSNRMYKAFKDTLELIENKFGEKSLSDLDIHKITKRPEFIRLKFQCRKTMNENSMPDLSDDLIDNLLIDQIKQGRKDEIEASYLDIEKSIYYFPLYPRVWFYLHQFNADTDIINFEGPFQIRRMSIFDQCYFKQDKEAFTRRSFANFIVETKPGVMSPKKEKDGSFKIPKVCPLQGQIQLLLYALRLIRISSVGVKNLNYYIPALVEKDSRRVASILLEYTPPSEFFPGVLSRHEKDVCKLDDNEIEFLKKLVKHLGPIPDIMKKEDLRTLVRALRRYNAALVSADIEDEIVDFIIALETLCKMSGFKMVYNVSYFIGISESDRKKVMDILDKAYSTRSKIVHGGSIKEKDLDVIRKIPSIVQKAMLFASVMGVADDKLRKLVRDMAFNNKKLEKHRALLDEWSPSMS